MAESTDRPRELVDVEAVDEGECELEHTLRDILPTHPDSAGFVFTTPGGAPIDQANFMLRVWAPMLRRLGLRARRFYATRHTYISFMLAAGARPLFVARQTGTSLKMIEERYGQARTCCPPTSTI